MSYMYNPNVTTQAYPQYGYSWPGYPQTQTPGTTSPATPAFPTTPAVPTAPPVGGAGMLPLEQSFIENILRLNRGKVADVHMTFEREGGSQSQIFRGVIEAAGRDHIILSDPETGKRYLLLTVYLDYVTFNEPIEYSYPIGQMSTYAPR
ncbi:spore coat protein GerQ [Aneurinibacillus migulanus]|jgi:spore germination protein Q|uniref:Spore germination protein Q n=2 Tax=Aneurinibacillus migulanus TaxID=47500 RepID=A0A1G8QA82_ANEMI|nr:spore coat protein GerQ [Aneurinibacillus migulanus]MED0893973.1 spore coat protein GerQ [Aneurinibacillus migulanus]MED1616738.1 spore coat protein GerQ [Aneurinibacillus migulanus]MED4730723.1 spore coat protein GerQ [Aneurinibacillus migulanus]SDJ01000.1 spore germination protein Q [Aneurinibacillus migulanus]GED13582.1 hypothetical protein AMI01nite_15730 [Aneurinibacillus migulanus]